jgi:hypothetical protein
VGPRLGDKVLAVDGVSKAFGDRLLVDGMSFDVPPGGGAAGAAQALPCLQAALKRCLNIVQQQLNSCAGS